MQFHPSYHLVRAFPLPLYVGYLFFGGIHHYPVDSCSASSCKFGVLTGEDECMSFYSTIFLRHTKFRLVKAMVFPVVVYGCESWTIKKAEYQRIDAFDLLC